MPPGTAAFRYRWFWEGRAGGRGLPRREVDGFPLHGMAGIGPSIGQIGAMSSGGTAAKNRGFGRSRGAGSGRQPAFWGSRFWGIWTERVAGGTARLPRFCPVDTVFSGGNCSHFCGCCAFTVREYLRSRRGFPAGKRCRGYRETECRRSSGLASAGDRWLPGWPWFRPTA